MAGGKETPRQKMIGMMYLVLLAMLAMNVSKQIVYAFVTLNDKLAISEHALDNQSKGISDAFVTKITSTQNQKEKADIKVWQERNRQVQQMANRVADYLLMETSAVIEADEGKPWHETDEHGHLTLKPLMDIEGKDKFDGAPRLFIENKERGNKLRTTLLNYRDSVCQIMATYSKGKGNKKKDFSFTPAFDGTSLVTFDDHGHIEDITPLREALKSANTEDTAAIIKVYKALTIPETLKDHDGNPVSWQVYTFDHCPVVAASAIMTALKVDVRNASAVAGEHFLSKIDVVDFKFNKIEPLAFASTGYINQGDSLGLSVMIAAYDSTSEKVIRFGVDADTASPDKWKQVSGKIGLRGDSPGLHKVKGVIMVEKRGELIPKPWEFSYTVGAPMGVVALPEMRVLYRGYQNIVEGTASGFPADKVSLSGSGCSLSSKGGGKYVATVGRGVRTATISVSGKKEDGTSVGLGSFKFDVKALPTPNVYLGGISNGKTPGLSSVKAQTRLSCRYDESVPLTGVNFTISGGKVSVDGIMKKGKVKPGGTLDKNALSILRQSRGKQVSIIVNFKGPDGLSKRTGLIFTTR